MKIMKLILRWHQCTLPNHRCIVLQKTLTSLKGEFIDIVHHKHRSYIHTYRTLTQTFTTSKICG